MHWTRGTNSPQESAQHPSHSGEVEKSFSQAQKKGPLSRRLNQVLFLQNGMIAIFVATLGSILAMLFVVLGFLPGYQAPTQSVFPGVNWCASSGLVLYCLTLFFWRRRFSIFLDVICIDQKDETRKAKGIISMGAILKSSDSILVLWDCSYSSRLWCVWEPWMNEACFLKRFSRARGDSCDGPRHMRLKELQ